MKSGPLKKVPPLILPIPGKSRSRISEYSKPAFNKLDEKTQEERAVHKFTTRYDSYQGLLKKVSEMRLSGSVESEEPSTESESSSIRTRSSRSSHDLRNYMNYPGDTSPYDDSPSSSVHDGDNGPSYEEIPDLFPLPPPPAHNRNSVISFSGSLPSPPVEAQAIYTNEPPLVSRRRPSSLYSNTEIERQQLENFRIPRPTSIIYNNTSAEEVEDERTYVNTQERLSPPEDLFSDEVSESDKLRIEAFYKGLRTQLFVCGSLVNLYMRRGSSEDEWSFRCTGIPVVILESGDTRARVKKRIQIVVAEKGTALPLWSDTIDNLSAYQRSDPGFHTMCLSRNHRQMIGLSFTLQEEADKLLEHIERLTSNPENINISVPGSKKKTPKIKKAAPLPQKNNISSPCFFQHVTSVRAKDAPIYYSLQNYVEKIDAKDTEAKTKN